MSRILSLSLLFLILASAFHAEPLKYAHAARFTDPKTLVLYDASSADIPSSSLMAFTDFPPGSGSLSYADRATVLDTTTSGMDTFAGWVSNPTTTPGFPILDRTTGVQVNFSMQIESETHEKNNRAGFSVIVLDQNAKGIEISFWENEIWVQGDDQTGGLFRHSEGAAFATTASMTEYQVTILGDSYTLFADSAPLLNGPVRDYSSFSGFPDPYETPNLLFMGDDTTSSQARVKLKFVSVTGKEPVVPTATHASPTAVTPLGTVSSTPPAFAAPSPALTSRGVELCPAGWLSGAVMIFSATTMKIIRRRGKRL